MDNATIEAKLKDMGLQLNAVVRMRNDDGWCLSVANGAIIESFDDGRMIVNGPGASALRLVLSAKSSGSPAGKTWDLFGR